MKTPANQDLPEEAAAFIAAHPDVEAIDAFYADLCGISRGKRYPRAHLGKLMRDGLATPGSVFLMDQLGECHDIMGRGFSDGDPDSFGKPIPGSLQPMPWAEVPSAQVMLTFQEADGTPYAYEPRNVLARVVERLTDLGLTPVVAFELEFYLIDPERRPDGRPQTAPSPRTGKRLNDETQVYGMAPLEHFSRLMSDIVRCCQAQGIETGAITKEISGAQYEINLEHQADPLHAADQCIMFKRIIKSVAEQHGIEASFMAKPFPDAAGSGLHMHCSLLNADGENIFSEAADAPEGSIGDNLRHALGGALELLPDSLGIIAPNINSFRRYGPNIYVPVSRSWAQENRSVALRVPTGGRSARRIEHRMAGADANPYLTLATMLAGLHYGLTNKIDPGPPSEGNAGERVDPAFAFRPRRALEALAASGPMADYFGKDYIEAYVACKLAELDKFEAIVSPAEYSWYL